MKLDRFNTLQIAVIFSVGFACPAQSQATFYSREFSQDSLDSRLQALEVQTSNLVRKITDPENPGPNLSPGKNSDLNIDELTPRLLLLKNDLQNNWESAEVNSARVESYFESVSHWLTARILVGAPANPQDLEVTEILVPAEVSDRFNPMHRILRDAIGNPTPQFAVTRHGKTATLSIALSHLAGLELGTLSIHPTPERFFELIRVLTRLQLKENLAAAEFVAGIKSNRAAFPSPASDLDSKYLALREFDSIRKSNLTILHQRDFIHRLVTHFQKTYSKKIPHFPTQDLLNDFLEKTISSRTFDRKLKISAFLEQLEKSIEATEISVLESQLESNLSNHPAISSLGTSRISNDPTFADTLVKTLASAQLRAMVEILQKVTDTPTPDAPPHEIQLNQYSEFKSLWNTHQESIVNKIKTLHIQTLKEWIQAAELEAAEIVSPLIAHRSLIESSVLAAQKLALPDFQVIREIKPEQIPVFFLLAQLDRVKIRPQVIPQFTATFESASFQKRRQEYLEKIQSLTSKTILQDLLDHHGRSPHLMPYLESIEFTRKALGRSDVLSSESAVEFPRVDLDSLEPPAMERFSARVENQITNQSTVHLALPAPLFEKGQLFEGLSPQQARTLVAHQILEVRQDILDLVELGCLGGYWGIFANPEAPELTELARFAGISVETATRSVAQLFRSQLLDAHPLLEKPIVTPSGSSLLKDVLASASIQDAPQYVHLALAPLLREIEETLHSLEKLTEPSQILPILERSIFIQNALRARPEFQMAHSELMSTLAHPDATQLLRTFFLEKTVHAGFLALLAIQALDAVQGSTRNPGAWKSTRWTGVYQWPIRMLFKYTGLRTVLRLPVFTTRFIFKGIDPFIHGVTQGLLLGATAGATYNTYRQLTAEASQNTLLNQLHSSRISEEGSFFKSSAVDQLNSQYRFQWWMRMGEAGLMWTFLPGQLKIGLSPLSKTPKVFQELSIDQLATGLRTRNGTLIPTQELFDDLAAFKTLGSAPGRWNFEELKALGQLAEVRGTPRIALDSALNRLQNRIASGNTWQLSDWTQP